MIDETGASQIFSPKAVAIRPSASRRSRRPSPPWPISAQDRVEDDAEVLAPHAGHPEAGRSTVRQTKPSRLSSAIKLARDGLRDAEKPIGSYLFAGPTGVGKTEVAKQLAVSLGVELLRFDNV